MQDTTIEPAIHRRVPRQRRRWLWRGALTLAILLIVFLVVVQFVLKMTDIPRKVVIAQVQQAIGLRISASSVETGWLGHTKIRDATFWLPLASEPLLEAPSLVVTHTNLISIVLGSFDLYSMRLDKPLLHIRQNAGGEWNGLAAISLIQRTTDSGQTSTRPNRPIRLPEIVITDGRVIVTDRENHSISINPVTVTAGAVGPLLYQYEANLAENLHIAGQVTPTAGWEHQFAFTATQIDRIVRPLQSDFPEHANASGKWTGQIKENGATSGRLELENFSSDLLSAQGAAAITFSDTGIEALPKGLLIRLPNSGVSDAKIISGAIKIESTSLSLENLQISAYQGLVFASGKWNRIDHSAELHAAWREMVLNSALGLSGSIDASLQSPFPGHPKLQASISTTATTEAGTLQTALKLSGDGDSFNNIDWIADVDHISTSGRHPFDLRQVSARLRTTGKQLILDELHIANRPHLNARGRYGLSDQLWWLWVQGQDLPINVGEPEPLKLAFNIDSWGQHSFINLKSFYAHAGDLEVTGRGFYDSQLPKPVNMELQVDHLPLATGAEAADVLKGTLTGHVRLAGTIYPPALGMEGELEGNDLTIKQREVGDLHVGLSGDLNPNGARIQTTEMKLLGGFWKVVADWPGDVNQPAQIDVDLRSLPIAAAAEFANLDQVSGTLNSHVKFEIPSFRAARIGATGTFLATDLQARNIIAERADGAIDLHAGTLRLSPIHLALANGTATAQIEFPLDHPSQISAEMDLSNWPVQHDRSAASIGGHTKLSIDLAQRNIAGPLAFEALLTESGRSIGTVRIQADVQGKTLAANSISADLLGGAATGNALIDLANPLQSRGELNWLNIDSAAIANWVPGLTGLSGRLSGSAVLAPTTDVHRLGPLQLRLQQSAIGATFNGLEIGPSSMTVYFDRDRIVTENGQFDLAAGQVKLFARLTRRPDESLASIVSVNFASIDLNQIVHAADPSYREQMPGRTSGAFTLAGDPLSPREMFGDGEFHLAQSDLINFDPLSLVYHLLNVAAPVSEPSGTADVRARLEGRNLTVNSARIFNRGIEIRGTATLSEIWTVPNSAISGTAVGSARPLRNLKLPFLADLDQILTVLQSNITTVRVSGTLRNPKEDVGAFADIGNELRSLLIGDMKGENSNAGAK